MPEYSYEEIHAERYRLSQEWLKTIPAGNVLEVGAPDGFSSRLKTMYPSVTNTDFDLRFGKHWRTVENQFDLVVAMEILEHIGDPIRSASTIEEVSRFDSSGVRNFMTGCFNALKPGGKLFLTTPNGGSVEVVRRALNGYTPIAYGLHVREHGEKDVVKFVEDAGFKIQRVDYLSPYLKFCTPAEIEERAAIRVALRQRWPAIMRGETTFLIAARP